MNGSKNRVARVHKTQNLRRSGAAGVHGDRRTKRVRTRAAQKSRALRDWN